MSASNVYSDLDEYTQTTLVRVARGLPIPAAELNHAARVLVARFTDPSREENWLKRPATRTCLGCGTTWKTRLSLLASPVYCTPECEQEARRRLEGALSGR